MATTKINGHLCRYSVNEQRWLPVSTNANILKCKHCGKETTKDGHDACISNLGKVVNACCGHGGVGYIQFEDGTIIRGVFSIERVV